MTAAVSSPFPANDDAVPRRRWRIAWLLGLGVLVNYFDRVNLSVSHEALVTSFGISAITFGYLSAAYNWTYALCQLPVGVLLDRFGVKPIGRISTLIWSLASFGAAATPSIPGFFAARLVLGVGEAPVFPASAKAVGNWFPRQERSFATSMFDGCAKFSSAIGVPVIGLFLIRFGWRWSFAATGLVSLLYFLLFAVVYREPYEDSKLTPAEKAHIINTPTVTDFVLTPDPPAASLGYLLRQPKVLGVSIGSGAYNYVFYLLLTWLPSYLSSALHVDLLHSFLYTGVPWLFATCTALLLGGWLVDHLVRLGWNETRVRKTVLVTGTAFGLGILGAAHAHTPGAALFWISMSIGGLSAASPIIWSVPSLIAPRGSVGSISGILNLANQISGILAPIITGYLVARTHNYTLAFAVSAAYILVGIAAYLILLGRIEPFPEPAPPLP